MTAPTDPKQLEPAEYGCASDEDVTHWLANARQVGSTLVKVDEYTATMSPKKGTARTIWVLDAHTNERVLLNRWL